MTDDELVFMSKVIGTDTSKMSYVLPPQPKLDCYIISLLVKMRWLQIRRISWIPGVVHPKI